MRKLLKREKVCESHKIWCKTNHLQYIHNYLIRLRCDLSITPEQFKPYVSIVRTPVFDKGDYYSNDKHKKILVIIQI